MLKKICLIVLILVLIVPAVTAHPAWSAARLDKLIRSYSDQNQFSGSVLVAREGRVILRKGYGMANYELDSPNTRLTKFRIASVSKQFTAAAVMLLQERRALKVQDPIGKYLPGYPNGQTITIHHLLTHTSGIPDYSRSDDFQTWKGRHLGIGKIVEQFRDRPLEFNPGTRFRYSNSGYLLLGLIIERVTGKPYEQFLRESLFRPLKMISSGQDQRTRLIRNRACGYAVKDGKLVNGGVIDTSVAYGSSSLYSTIGDLYRWDMAISRRKLLKRDTIERMLMFYAEQKEPEFPYYGKKYGYGWWTGEEYGRRMVFHSGFIDGFTAYNKIFVDEKTCIILLCNIEHLPVDEIAAGITKILFDPALNKSAHKKAAHPAARLREKSQITTSFTGSGKTAQGGF
jgi:CubicO group peptidase (beta-lactamase class C family)